MTFQNFSGKFATMDNDTKNLAEARAAYSAANNRMTEVIAAMLEGNVEKAAKSFQKWEEMMKYAIECGHKIENST